MGIVRVKAAKIPRTMKWYSLRGCRTAQALLNSQLNNTELTKDSEVQISLEMYVWGNCFSLNICCPEQEHGANTGNKVRTTVL